MTQMNLSAVEAGEVHHLPKLGKAISYNNKPQASENEGLKAEKPVVKKDLKKKRTAKGDGAVAPLNDPLEKLGKNVVVGTQFDKSVPQGLAPENNFLTNPVIVNSTTPEHQKKDQKVEMGEPNQTVAISNSGTVAAENGSAYSGPGDSKAGDEKKSETKTPPKEDFQKYNDENIVDPSPEKAPSKVAVQYNGGASDDNIDFSSGKDSKATEKILSNKLTSVNEIKEKQISPKEGKITPKEEKGDSFAEGFAKTKKTESKGNKAIYDSKPIIASRKREEVINMGLWEEAKKHSEYRQPTAAKEANVTPTGYHGHEEDNRPAVEKKDKDNVLAPKRKAKKSKKNKESFVVSASMHHKNLPNTDYVEPTAAKEANITPTGYHGHEEDNRPAVEKKDKDNVLAPKRKAKKSKKNKESFVVSASMHHKNLPNTDYVEPTAAKEAHITPTGYHGHEEDSRPAVEKKDKDNVLAPKRKAKEAFVVSASMHAKNRPNTEYAQPTPLKDAEIIPTGYHGHERDNRPAVEKKDKDNVLAPKRKNKEAFVVSASMHAKNRPNTEYAQPTPLKDAEIIPTGYHGHERDNRPAVEKKDKDNVLAPKRKAKEAFVVSASMHHKNLPNTDYVEPTAAKEANVTPTGYHGHEEDHRPAVEKKDKDNVLAPKRKNKEAFVVSASMHAKNRPNTEYAQPTAAKEAHITPTGYHGHEEDSRPAVEKKDKDNVLAPKRKSKDEKVEVDTQTFHASNPNSALGQPSKPVEAKTVESNYDGSVPKTEVPKTAEKVENFGLFEAQKNGELNKKGSLSVKPAKKDSSLKKEEGPKETKKTEAPKASANLRVGQKTDEKKDNVTINPPESSSKTIYLIAVFSLVGLLFLAVVVFKIK